MGWQWHQLDHTQIICTSSLQTDNQITMPAPHHSILLQAGCSSWLICALGQSCYGLSAGNGRYPPTPKVRCSSWRAINSLKALKAVLQGQNCWLPYHQTTPPTTGLQETWTQHSTASKQWRCYYKDRNAGCHTIRWHLRPQVCRKHELSILYLIFDLLFLVERKRAT